MREENQGTGVGVSHPSRTVTIACHSFKTLLKIITLDAFHYLFPLNEHCFLDSPPAFLCSLHTAVVTIS